MTINAKTDDELIAIVRCLDRISAPLADRFDGDDEDIVILMKEMGLKQTIVDKLLIAGLVLRECVSRGIKIGNPNH